MKEHADEGGGDWGWGEGRGKEDATQRAAPGIVEAMQPGHAMAALQSAHKAGRTFSRRGRHGLCQPKRHPHVATLISRCQQLLARWQRRPTTTRQIANVGCPPWLAPATPPTIPGASFGAALRSKAAASGCLLDAVWGAVKGRVCMVQGKPLVITSNRMGLGLVLLAFSSLRFKFLV